MMMQQATFDVLKHIHVHGGRTRAEVLKAFPQCVKAVENLAMLGYLTPDGISTPHNYILTQKGKAKVAQPFVAPKGRTGRLPKHDIERLRAQPSLPATTARQKQRRDPKLYQATEYEPSVRPGAMKAFQLPSRFGNRLRWPDGRVTDMDGNAVD